MLWVQYFNICNEVFWEPVDIYAVTEDKVIPECI